MAKTSKVILQISKILNTGLSGQNVVREMSQILQECIPCHRLSLGLHILDRWYFYQNDELRMLRPFLTVSPQHMTQSASHDAFALSQPIKRDNISEDQRYIHDKKLIAEGMRSDLIVPIILDNHYVAGTLNFTDTKPHQYTQEHLNTVLSLIDIVAVVIKHLYSQYEMQALHEIISVVQTSHKLEDTLDLILEHIRGQGYDRVRIYLYDESDHALVGTRQVGSDPIASFRGEKVSISTDSHSQKIFSTQKAQIYQRRNTHSAFRDQLQDVLGTSDYEWAELPLINNGIVGKISLDNAPHKFPLDPLRIDRLMIYASQAALAIHHAQLHQTLNEYLSQQHPGRYTTLDVANILNLSENAVRLLARTKNVGTRMGRSWTFTPEDVRQMKNRKPRGRPRKDEV
ncbi:MAG: GAF domain-containing protein [Candidatus Latescibacteria bacterium]|jgi:transcriptional regulator with GAF, ATPase, and Fis domain|nr:GAF domain-containing protein [Candidatus Latescibacterota bacterium]MBT5830084.1 GAF domain-containing protein [Candidatus Latescibacterota bacterium]